MLERLQKYHRALRTCMRSFRASLKGPERGTEKVKRVLTSLGHRQRSMLPEDPELAASVYFKKRAFRRLQRCIAGAKRSIDMRMFIWRADSTGREVAGLLLDAAKRGVAVTVHKEIVGDVFELSDDFRTTKDDGDSVWQAFWRHPNITVHHENNHDHSKTYVIDGELLLVSSMNIGDEYCNNWHECLVELRGQKFVDDFLRNRANPPTLSPEGQIEVLRSSAKHPMLPVVLSLIEGATKTIRIEMAYFSDPSILELLAKKTHEGVVVVLILPHATGLHHHANLAAAERFLKLSRSRRALIFRYPRALLHTKMIIVDRRTLFIGSTNLITSSLVKMGETNVLIHRHPKRCLRIARRRFARDVVQSVRVRATDLTRTTWQRFLSWLQL